MAAWWILVIFILIFILYVSLSFYLPILTDICSKMFAAIKEALGTERLESTGRGGGGCINEGEVFKTDKGQIFLKRNSKSKVNNVVCLVNFCFIFYN